MPKLQKVQKTNLSDQVCKLIKDNIKTGEWAEDSRIPSENVLAELYGVNRLTVRNALQKLNAMGIVETRAGQGTFVKKFDLQEYIREVSDLVLSPEMLEDVMEFRKCIELECISLAIKRVDNQNLDELEKAFDAYEAAGEEQTTTMEKHLDDIVEADLNFHYQICSLSRNSLFMLAFNAVREPMYQYIKSVLIKRFANVSKKKNASAIATNDHKIIMDAIKRKDYKACEEVYMNMIDYNS